MLAPRSYLFTAAHSKETRNERHSMSMRGSGSRSPTKRDKASPTSIPPSKITTAEIERPTTPSSPVIIPPMRGSYDASQRMQVPKGRHNQRRKPRTHSPDAISPSVAALLAMTKIPTLKQTRSIRKRSGTGQRLTVDAILRHADVSEKELSVSFGKSPLDYLLSSPEESQDELAPSENGYESVVSTRTISCDSMPSLDDESISEVSPSLNSLGTPSSRGRRSLPTRRILSSPPVALYDHPLSAPDIDIDELDFRVFQRQQPQGQKAPRVEINSSRRKSAFKSNLTASLRALRSAARSFSSITTPMITPDDFLTRSIISIDPQVPFTDERMPPRLEDAPTPELRRYLNPTTNAPIEAHVSSSLAQTMSATKCTASIQMETYSVNRSGKSKSPSVISRRSQTNEDDFAQVAGPVARQREIRENSDFLRIAVMEMAMRKNGKLDDQKPGRAVWALPARKAPTEAYERGKDGVPLRWVAQIS
ncbi:hypothetical protein LHYA1_G005035 [Lachnellula hyalina]|uniref:Uncharacterized protein n=1 Tax=Lachnellula hyalina TaxID=1316788 RepID=A0A8H8U0F0_9HELO|nr:uncharacterized protein LHYA1_G005035 [Lachnellula hyalina]TVY25976.1 hypothetical protein LHYA1_G005035 [Lachnellula hyalina]